MSSREVYAIFVAGGSGTRMGGDVPKQFLDLCGEPVLLRSIGRFLEAAPSAHVIVVLPAAHIQTWRELCVKHAVSFAQTIVKGGMTRFHSVQAALEKVPDGVIVAVHAGVRPLVSPAMVRGMIESMEAGVYTGAGSGAISTSAVRALIPALPVTDTLRCLEPGTTLPPRSSLVAVQTPQMFLSEDIKRAYAQPYDTSFTDDASVVERLGIHISIFPGEKFNIKITTPEDLALARLLLAQQ